MHMESIRKCIIYTVVASWDFVGGAVSKGPGVEMRNRWELEVLVDPRRGSPQLSRGQSHH